MRLLSIASLYPAPSRPGFGRFVARSLEALAAREDWALTVVNPIGLPPIAAGRYRALTGDLGVERVNGVAVHHVRFPLLPGIGGRLNPGAIARSVLPLARRLHGEAPFDLVDAQFFYPDGPAAARIAAALDLPLAIKARGGDIHRWGALGYARRAMRAAAERAAITLAVSEALARDMAALGLPDGRTQVHYTGLDRNRFRPLGHPTLRAQLAERLGLPLRRGEPLLMGVGALIPLKGHEFTIGALADLPDARLLLIGHGPDRDRLRLIARRAGVAARVHFMGQIDHDLLPPLLSAADAMVLPSANEGLANAWVEALACGTPIVVTDVGGAREVVTTPAAGRIAARDPGAIAAAVRDLLADPPDAADVAQAAARFDWQRHAEALAGHYRRIVERA